MGLYIRRISAALLFLSAASGAPPMVQPGAPGQKSKTLSTGTAAKSLRTPAEADISFMQGMIMHHAQAVEMTALLRVRSQNKDLQTLGERMTISQSDEMEYMKQWLADRGKPVAPTDAHMDHMGDMKGMADMKGMDHSAMGHMDMGAMPMSSMPMMPGMLTPQQMKALSEATGPQFDHLFLTGMIQHHTGALVMVQDLFDTPGAGQDAVLFDFATDVENTQRAEINIMQGMLLKEKQ